MTQDIVSIVDPLIPIREAFGLAGLRTTKGYDEIKAGRLKPVRNGPRTFIRASEIRRYIDAIETSSIPEVGN
ncbi:hypothetical protein [Bosea sp. NPDC055594]